MRVLEAALAASAAGAPAALCTVIAVNGSAPRSASARMLVYGDGRIVGTIGGGQWEKVVIDAALVCIREGSARRVAAHLTRDLGMCCGGAMEAFVEPITPVERVHLFGAGHVGGALAPLLLSLGFELRVYDEREEWLNAERFPGLRACAPRPPAGDPRGARPPRLRRARDPQPPPRSRPA
jgi:xanthine dehydrogenase accessory factor